MLSRRDRQRVLIGLALRGTVVLLGLVMIGLLIASILLAFLTVTSPAMATFLTALCLAALTLPLALFLSSSRRCRIGFLGEDMDSLLSGLLRTTRRKPIGAIGAALALGVMTELMQRGGSSSDDDGRARS